MSLAVNQETIQPC